LSGLSDLLADMSGQDRICSVWGQISPVKLDELQRKNRSGFKTMNLGSNKLMTSKQDTREQVEINRATNFNLFTRMTTRVRSNLNKNKLDLDQQCN
jgi:hypothetical protein